MTDLNQRSRDIFSHIVEAFVTTGEPVGSATLSRTLGLNLSSATIRNVMAELEEAGLLYSPHTSAGRLPTEQGLRFFVHGLLEVGGLNPQEQADLERLCTHRRRDVHTLLEEVTAALSGMTHCAGLVLAPKTEAALTHLEFVSLSPDRVLLVLVTGNGAVENRLLELTDPIPPTDLIQASNYLNALVQGKTLSELQALLQTQMMTHRTELDTLVNRLMKKGLAQWAGEPRERALIVRGQSHLIQDIQAQTELETLRRIFNMLDQKEAMGALLDQAIAAEGVQVFIGSENPLFPHAGCATIIAPYKNAQDQIIGALGVVGPARMNYSRVIPLVDYTAQIVSKLIG